MTTILERAPAVPPHPLHASPFPTGDVSRIPAREGWATYPAIALDGSGIPWVAWLERLDGADSIWLQAAAGVPTRLTRAAAIKDGPALAWTVADGLTCAWQFSADRASGAWQLAVARHVDRPSATPETVPTDHAGHAGRPSHPVLASDGLQLALAYEHHGPSGAEIHLCTRVDDHWSPPVRLSGTSESAYDPALAITPAGLLWATWIEARAARLDVWAACAPLAQAHHPGAWSTPERLSGGPHFSAAPRLLATGEDVWLTWSNYSGDDAALLGKPWANGPERRWERILFETRRRVHVRRWSAAEQRWSPEWREPDPDREPAINPQHRPSTPNTHWPVLFPLPSQPGDPTPTSSAVGLLCRRTLRFFRWTVEAHRLQAHPDGRITWSPPTTIAAVTGPDDDETATAAGIAGGNMPVAVTSNPNHQLYAAWQRHDRARTAPGFHFTMGASQILLAPLEHGRLPADSSLDGTAVGPATSAPALVAERPAPRTITVNGEIFQLVFGNLHRHAECSSCGRDANGPAEQHMRHAPDVNRSEFLSVTDHGEHLNDGEWREQCLLADFYTWPGHRVALPGIEWTSEAPWHPPAHGHKNIIFSRGDLPFVDCWMPHSDHPDRLWAWLDQHDPQAVTIPHHMMRGKAPTLWEHASERFQPVIEIFQDTRGSCEWLGAPAATSTTRVQGLGLDPRGSVRRALDRGLKLGFIASSDHGGVALGGLYVKTLTREGILEALRARRCFATTGDRLLLDFRVDDTFQGGALTLSDLPRGPQNQAPPLTITLRAAVLRPVQRVVLVRDGVEALVETPDPSARTIDHTWTVEGPFVGTSYFYVRLECADGELAWSSPVWVTRDWGGAQ